MPDTDVSRGSSFTNRDLTSIGIKTWMSISMQDGRPCRCGPTGLSLIEDFSHQPVDFQCPIPYHS